MGEISHQIPAIKFQSRNRETFDFNPERDAPSTLLNFCFNLVIEKLLISIHKSHCSVSIRRLMFQSRNRETFDFNSSIWVIFNSPVFRFNLVIEKLLIPTMYIIISINVSFSSFNLVIEKLLIPTTCRFILPRYIISTVSIS